MAIHPNTFTSKFSLQPGARGEKFQADMPGYRNQGERINRTNMNLNVSPHDSPAVKYSLDERLESMFRFGYAHGYNQLVVTKGRIMAVDGYKMQVDYDTKKMNNVLTIANGGTAVKNVDGLWTNATDLVNEQSVGGTGVINYARGNSGVTIESNGSASVTVGGKQVEVRPANVPIGIMQRNEYTRDADAFNGMQPSPVITEHMVELPYFPDAASAEGNPWGSIYGTLKPGDMVKSDNNGRFIVSPLSRLDIEAVAKEFPTAVSIELERQQVVGQVVEVRKDLVPAGAAKYVQWALEDRMDFEPYNPTMWAQNGRKGEDLVDKVPYSMRAAFGQCGINEDQTGKDPFEPSGYPYDQTMSQNDLHMLGSASRKSDLRMPMEHMIEMGIPGLTDGYNAHKRTFGPELLTMLHAAAKVEDYIEVSMKTSQVDILAKSDRDPEAGIKICVTDQILEDVINDENNWTTLLEGSNIPVVAKAAGTVANAIHVRYASELQGFIVLKPLAPCHEIFTGKDAVVDPVANAVPGVNELKVYVKYQKRGLAGVPTMLDWDHCMGIVSVLLQK